LIASSFETLLNDIGLLSQYAGFHTVESIHFIKSKAKQLGKLILSNDKF
jgi:hypothetical protein